MYSADKACLPFPLECNTLNHHLSVICKKSLSALPKRSHKRFVAMASGISLAAALTVASFPASAYQFVAGNSAVIAAAAVTTTVGCGRPAAQTGLFNLNTTDGLGTIRTFEVHVPADYNPTKAYALTFVFHGAGGNSAQSYSWGLQNVSGASEASIFVFPNGVAFKGYGVGWDDRTHGYDMPFFDNMVKKIETSYCINSARVFAAGFSWGGDFVTALACNRGSVVRAAVINSASDEFNDHANYLTYQNLPCPTASYPAIRFVHAIGGDGAYPSPDFATTSKLLQSFHACKSTCGVVSTSVPSSTSAMTCVSYNGCGKELVECSFNTSIGHALPPNWAADTWAFFQTFP
jgi:poly(3-hydroxybutyrate) depolymerase